MLLVPRESLNHLQLRGLHVAYMSQVFFVVMSAVRHESLRLTEMYKLSRKDTELHLSRSIFPCVQGSPPYMTLRSARDLEVIPTRPKLLYATFFGSESMVPEIHDIHIVCLLKVVTPEWVINRISFALVVEVLQVKSKLFFSREPPGP